MNQNNWNWWLFWIYFSVLKNVNSEMFWIHKKCKQQNFLNLKLSSQHVFLAQNSPSKEPPASTLIQKAHTNSAVLLIIGILCNFKLKIFITKKKKIIKHKKDFFINRVFKTKMSNVQCIKNERKKKSLFFLVDHLPGPLNNSTKNK